MGLKLTPEDAARYEELVRKAEADKQSAIARGDQKEARKARQWISHLYNHYAAKQVQSELPSRRQREYEELTLEERVARIERVLGLTRFG